MGKVPPFWKRFFNAFLGSIDSTEVKNTFGRKNWEHFRGILDILSRLPIQIWLEYRTEDSSTSSSMYYSRIIYMYDSVGAIKEIRDIHEFQVSSTKSINYRRTSRFRHSNMFSLT